MPSTPIFELTDDGTLDTVVYCTACGEELRYTFDGEGEQDYDQFVEWALENASDEHECSQEEESV